MGLSPESDFMGDETTKGWELPAGPESLERLQEVESELSHPDEAIIETAVELYERGPGDEEWKRMSLDRRQEFLQMFENQMAQASNRLPREVAIVDLNEGLYGQTDGNTIEINANMADRRSDMLDTALHEGYHCYQDEAIKRGPYFDYRSETWKRNKANYISPEYPTEYARQPLEKDAFDLETQVHERLEQGR